MLRQSVRKMFKRLFFLPQAIQATKLGYLRDVGWFHSMRASMPIDRDGQPVPWYSYSAIHFLEKQHEENGLLSSLNVFEYGIGNSTLWWAGNSHTVTACEHDHSWFEQVQRIVPANVTLHFTELDIDGQYARAAVNTGEQYDIVVVDGRDRSNCARHAKDALSKQGVIIWDDSLRKDYQDGMLYLIKEGFRRVDFIGLGPITNNRQSTTIFYRDDNCLGL